MAAPMKYPDELRERAIRRAVDARRGPATPTGASKRIAEQLGIDAETLRNCPCRACPPCPLGWLPTGGDGMSDDRGSASTHTDHPLRCGCCGRTRSPSRLAELGYTAGTFGTSAG